MAVPLLAKVAPEGIDIVSPEAPIDKKDLADKIYDKFMED